MTWRICNVPNKNDSTQDIQCVVTKYGDYDVKSKGVHITTLSGHSKESTASDIASVIRQVRDIGFAQGQAHVRNALGI